MDTDTEFIDYAKRKIEQKESLIAVDDMDKEFFGFIGFSRHFNRITWFGVLEKYRNKGIGSKLLEMALKELDKTKEITVETYRENFIPGQPARYVYKKYGFIETENNLFDSFGNERCKLSIILN
jgi:ribosomal protein S18 acetylase RimI-like enzyme